MHKKLALALAVGYTLSLTILSLISIKGIPKLGSNFDDKIYHCVAYAGLTLVWYIFFRQTSFKYQIVPSAFMALGYGIIVEVLQGTFTTYRTEDFMDVLANSVGVLSAILLIYLYRMIKLK